MKLEKIRRELTLPSSCKQEIGLGGSTQVRDTVSRVQQGGAHAIGQLGVRLNVERLVVAKVTKSELVPITS